MSRFIRRGVSKILFNPTVANINTVTRAELTSATDLSDEIADVAGWMLDSASVPTPDLGSDFDSSIPGIKSVADSTLTFYEDEEDDTIETLLPAGTEGFIIIQRKGDKPTSTSMDVFPVRVASKGSEISMGNDAGRFQVRFNITDEPALDTAIPAAV